MLNNREIVRPDWKKIIQDKKIDLTKNVHYDKILNDKIKNIIQNSNFILNYANDSKIYQSISQPVAASFHLYSMMMMIMT